MTEDVSIKPEQIKAARALLRLDQEELARRASLSVSTIRRLEAAEGLDYVAPDTVDAVRGVLEEAGVEFIHDGVRRLNDKVDPALLADLRTIARQSVELQATLPRWTEDDLYDDYGLPA
jgi:transcriptional regulator with XRE-family HTH domain